HFFIGAARGRDAAHGLAPVLLLDFPEAPRAVLDRFVPADFLPRVVDALADHGVQHAFLVRRITPGEAPLDATVAMVRLAVLVRRHAHDLVALHFRLERTTDAAIGAGGQHTMLRLAVVDDGFLHQRRGRAGLHAGAAGHAFGIEKVFRHAGRDLGVE